MVGGALLGALLAASSAFAAGPGRFFGDFQLGAGYDDSALADARRRKDRFLFASYGVGWRGRPASRTTARAYYQFSHAGYSALSQEDFQRHRLEAAFSHRVADPARLLLEAEAEWHRLPGRAAFNTRRVSAAPGAEYRPFVRTALRGHLTYDAERYPNFDLDWHALGWRLQLEQEIGLDAAVSLLYAQRRRRFTERALFADAAGRSSDQRRSDRERWLELTGRWDLRRARARAGYGWAEVSSTGDRFDWGPNQSQSVNTIVGDERLVGEHFSRVAHGPFVGLGLRPSARLRLDLEHRWLLARYPGRPAKDAADGFAADGGVRRDWRRRLSAEATWLFRLWRRDLGLSASWSREDNSSTDALFSFARNRVFLGLRGWF